jgi:hypothetical protein
MSEHASNQALGFVLDLMVQEGRVTKHGQAALKATTLLLAGVEVHSPSGGVGTGQLKYKKDDRNSVFADAYFRWADSVIPTIEDRLSNFTAPSWMTSDIMHHKDIKLKTKMESTTLAKEAMWKGYERVMRALRKDYCTVWDKLAKGKIPSGKQLQEILEKLRKALYMLESKNKEKCIDMTDEDDVKAPSRSSFYDGGEKKGEKRVRTEEETPVASDTLPLAQGDVVAVEEEGGKEEEKDKAPDEAPSFEGDDDDEEEDEVATKTPDVDEVATKTPDVEDDKDVEVPSGWFPIYLLAFILLGPLGLEPCEQLRLTEAGGSTVPYGGIKTENSNGKTFSRKSLKKTKLEHDQAQADSDKSDQKKLTGETLPKTNKGRICELMEEQSERDKEFNKTFVTLTANQGKESKINAIERTIVRLKAEEEPDLARIAKFEERLDDLLLDEL